MILQIQLVTSPKSGCVYVFFFYLFCGFNIDSLAFVQRAYTNSSKQTKYDNIQHCINIIKGIILTSQCLHEQSEIFKSDYPTTF